MPLVIDSDQAEASSRLTAIRLALATSRCLEHWRRGVGDADSAMILIAVISITGERLTRSGLEAELKSIDRPIPRERLAPCNIASIAAATGFNRETTRRKVRKLVDEGYLLRSDNGEISMPPDLLQQPGIPTFLRRQLETVTRVANDLVKDGVLKVA